MLRIFICLVNSNIRYFWRRNISTFEPQTQVTDAPIVPPLVLFLAKHPLVNKFDLSSVVRVSSGAAPLSKELETALVTRLPQVLKLRQGGHMSNI